MLELVVAYAPGSVPKARATFVGCVEPAPVLVWLCQRERGEVCERVKTRPIFCHTCAAFHLNQRGDNDSQSPVIVVSLEKRSPNITGLFYKRTSATEEATGHMAAEVANGVNFSHIHPECSRKPDPVRLPEKF